MGFFAAMFEVRADSSNFEKGMNRVAQSADKVGGKLASAFDSRAIGHTFATALGLSLTDVADKAARFWIGFSKEAEDSLEQQVKATEKAADAQIAALEKLRAKKERDAEEERDNFFRESKLISEARQKGNEEDAKFKEESMKDAVEFYKKEYAAVKNLADYERMTRREKMTDEAKLTDIMKELLQVQKSIATTQKEMKSGVTDVTTGSEQLLELKKKEAELQKEIVKLTKATVVEEKKVQEVVLETMKIKNTGKGDKELSDRELERKISTLRADVQDRSDAVFQGRGYSTAGVGGAYDPLLGPQQSYLQQAMAEQNLRNKVRMDVRAFGAQRAFEMNPGISEQRFSEITNTATQLDTIANRLQSIDQRLAGSKGGGLPVVNLNL